MERSRISSRDLRHFPEWCTGWCWWRWSGSVTMTAAGWSRSCLDDFPSDDIHSHTALLLLGCTSSIFSSPSKLPVFGTQPEEVAWKDVGKYHPCIHKSRKSWSNKSFESLLHHVCMADILQNRFPCSFLFAFFPSLYFTPSVGVHQCLSGAERSCASLGQETHRRRTLYPNIFSVQQDRRHQVNADPLTGCWLGWCWPPVSGGRLVVSWWWLRISNPAAFLLFCWWRGALCLTELSTWPNCKKQN